MPLIKVNKLTKAIDVLANRISAILKGQRGTTRDTSCTAGSIFQHQSRILDEPTEGLSTVPC